jgi:hypothetical protein
MTGNQAGGTWHDALVERHPDLFQVGTDGRTPGRPTVDDGRQDPAERAVISKNGRTYTPGKPTVGVGDGWRELVEIAISRIATVVAANPGATVKIVEVKRWRGTLRLYWRGRNLGAKAEHAIEDVVAMAEARSACTCEQCGNAGVLHARGDRLATACPDHARGDPVPVTPGLENVHIVRTFDGSRHPIACCCRYVRETDSFVDVGPQSLDVRE